MDAQIAANNRKTVLLFVVFFALVGAVAFGVGGYFGNFTYTIIALVFSAGYALWSYFASSRLALKMNGAQEVDKNSAPEFYRIVENLTIAAGMPMPKVYLMQDDAPNAFAAGRNPENAIVAATTGLLKIMTKSEVEGVMAHELGHVQNRDIRVGTIAFALVATIGLISDLMTRSLIFGGMNRDNNNNSASGVLVIFAIVGAILAPLAAKMIQLAISRRREFLADATGAQLTRYPEGLASALEKIGKYGSTMQKQNTTTAHLFFSNPLKPSSFSKLFSTHPPVEERVSILRGLESKGF